MYISNYYRGAYHQFPCHAGRSKHQFNTGTVAWVYQKVIEELFGLKGGDRGLRICPQLPRDWQTASVSRRFRGRLYHIQYRFRSSVDKVSLVAKRASVIDEQWISEDIFVSVKLPSAPPH